MHKTQILFNYKEDNYLDYKNQIESNQNTVAAQPTNTPEVATITDNNHAQTNISEKSKSSLPNIWDLVEQYLIDNKNIKYCMNYNSYYIYKNNLWTTIKKNQLTSLFINFIEFKYPKNFKNFNLKSLEEIFLLIQHRTLFSLPDAVNQDNVNGFLLPFLNGVLNVKTSEFKNHSPEFLILI